MPLILTTVARQANIVSDLLNVYAYAESVPVTSNAQLTEFIQEWIDNIQPAILAFQSDQIVYLEVRAEVLDGLYFSSISQGSVDGAISGTALPPYVAYEFIYRRATRVTRNGFKRFPGVIEEAIDQAGNVTGAAATALTAAETVLDDTLNMSWGTADPQIWGRPIPPSTAHRFNDITEVAFQRVTTQNSRKPW